MQFCQFCQNRQNSVFLNQCLFSKNSVYSPKNSVYSRSKTSKTVSDPALIKPDFKSAANPEKQWSQWCQRGPSGVNVVSNRSQSGLNLKNMKNIKFHEIVRF